MELAMAWTIDDSQPRILYNKDKHVAVTPSAMGKYHEWRREIERGSDPKSAAGKVGDMHYEQLSGNNKGIYTIRLSQEHRVAFTINGTLQQVKVISIGGHFPPS
jgi:plasmid maintenance system killer protein